MKRIMNYAGCVGRYLRDTRAVAAMEYAIIVGVVVIGVGAAVISFNKQITALFENVTTDLTGLKDDVKAENAAE